MSTSNLLDGLPSSVTVVEVGPRDGLQNEKGQVPAEVKIAFIDSLSRAGLPVVEATSFVSPKWVPQLADADDVLKGITQVPGVRYPVLVPNETGLERAIAARVEEIAVFASATETFSMKNLNRSRTEAIEMFRPVCRRALETGMRVRGYISMVINDPWEGPVPPEQVVETAQGLIEIGCQELSLGDTTGAGTPADVRRLLAALFDADIPAGSLAVHFHDTYGQGLANVLAALTMGITIVDSSAGGLGGCPFAKSATGNLATEDLVWMLDGFGINTGVDVAKVAAASMELCRHLGKEPPGRVARALVSRS